MKQMRIECRVSEKGDAENLKVHERQAIPRKMMKDARKFSQSTQVGSDGKRRVGRSKIGN